MKEVETARPKDAKFWDRLSPAKALKVMGASSDGFVFPRFCTVWSTSSAAVPPMCRKKPLQVNVTHLTHFDTLITSCIMHLLVNTQVSQTLLMRSLAMLVNLSFKTAPCSTVIWKNELWTSAPNTRCLFLIFIFIISMLATQKPAPGLPDLWWDSPWLPLQLGSNSCLENTETKFPVSMTKKFTQCQTMSQGRTLSSFNKHCVDPTLKTQHTGHTPATVARAKADGNGRSWTSICHAFFFLSWHGPLMSIVHASNAKCW